MPLAYGQGSGDFRETSGRVQIFHVGRRDSLGIMAADAFTQANPPVVTTNVSTTLTGITRTGVLGSSVAFTRGDAGNGYIGGPDATGGVGTATCKPLGLFINDAVGNAYENTPGVASNRGPYLAGMSSVGVTLYETLNLNSGAALTYAVGDKLYASANGLLTNVAADNNLFEQTTYTVIGVLKVVPDASNSLMVLDMRI